METVLEQGAAELLLNQALALSRFLPLREPNFLHDVIDISHNTFHDDMSVRAFRLFEQFCQGFLCPITFRYRIDVFFSFDDFLSQFEHLLEEFEAGKETLFVAFLDLFQSLAQSGKFGVAWMFAKAGNQFDLNFLPLLLRVGSSENLIQDLRVHDQSLYVVPHRFYVNILVDQFYGFRAQGVPEKFAVAARGLYCFIHLRKPAVIRFEWAEQWVRG